MRKNLLAWAASFGFLLVLLIGPIGIANGVYATKFDSNGDLIQGWYWLRDRGLQHYAEWTFTNVPPGTDDIVIGITALATDRASGDRGFSARFRLLYGFPGAGPMGGVFEVVEVTLPNVSPPSDPVGYTCKGQVVIPRSALHGGSQLFLRVERISPTDNHVAFNEDSMAILLGSGQGTGGQGGTVQPSEHGAAAKAELLAVPADNFRSSGDPILGIYWCRRQGHFLEWTWKPISEPRAIVEAAVNLELLVTNKVNGGSGWGTTVEVTLLDPAGTQVASGQVELVNPFRPRFLDDTHGIGYKTYGVFSLPDPNLVRTGFRLRMAWPPSDGSGFHFGGAKDRALLVLVAAPQGTSGATLPSVHVQDILSDPRAYLNRKVELVGEFHGWQGGLTSCPPPVTRGDWLVGEAGAYICATGPFPEGLFPWDEGSIGKSITVVGTVRLKTDPTAGPCPYIEVEEAWPTEGSASGCLAAIPVYPGATLSTVLQGQASSLVQSLSEVSLAGGEVAVYTCSAALGDVVSFYEQAMAAAGWEKELALAPENGFVVIWSKEALSAQLVVAVEQGRTVIVVGCGKKL